MGPALLDEIPKELIERYKGSWMGCNLVSRKTLRLNGLGADEYAQALRGIATRGDESLALYVHILPRAFSLLRLQHQRHARWRSHR